MQPGPLRPAPRPALSTLGCCRAHALPPAAAFAPAALPITLSAHPEPQTASPARLGCTELRLLLAPPSPQRRVEAGGTHPARVRQPAGPPPRQDGIGRGCRTGRHSQTLPSAQSQAGTRFATAVSRSGAALQAPSSKPTERPNPVPSAGRGCWGTHQHRLHRRPRARTGTLQEHPLRENSASPPAGFSHRHKFLPEVSPASTGPAPVHRCGRSRLAAPPHLLLITGRQRLQVVN